MSRCCAVTQTEASTLAARAAWMTGAILMASGRVPKTVRMRMSSLSPRGREERLRDASGKDRPIVRFNEMVPIRLPGDGTCLDEGIAPGGGIWLREEYIWPAKPLPCLQRRGHDHFAAGRVFDNFDLKGEVRPWREALREDAHIKCVEVRGNFGRCNAARRNYATATRGVDQGLPIVRRANDK